MKRLSWFVLFLLLAVSCLDQPDCYQLNNNYLGVVFKIIGGANDRVYLKSISSSGAHPDSLLKNPITTDRISFSLNPFATGGKFFFEGYYAPFPNQILKHELDVTYLARVQFVSEDCGERYVFTDVDVPSSSFDSIRIVNSVPGPEKTPSTNIELLRCPRTNLMNLDFLGTISVNTIYVQELDTTFDVKGTISDFVLPLAKTGGKTTFDFLYTDGTKKTLTVTYRTTVRSRFEPCGEQSFIDRITYNANAATPGFANVRVLEDSVFDLPTTVNLEITP